MDSVDAVNDGLDTLLERREVRPLQQALQRVGEVNGGVPNFHLGEHLGQGTPAGPPGLVGQISCLVGADLFQGIEDALEECIKPIISRVDRVKRVEGQRQD